MAHEHRPCPQTIDAFLSFLISTRRLWTSAVMMPWLQSLPVVLSPPGSKTRTGRVGTMSTCSESSPTSLSRGSLHQLSATPSRVFRLAQASLPCCVSSCHAHPKTLRSFVCQMPTRCSSKHGCRASAFAHSSCASSPTQRILMRTDNFSSAPSTRTTACGAH